MYSLIGQWRSSGQTQRIFCESRGVAYGTFKYWVKKQKEEKASKIKNRLSRPPVLVPLNISPVATTSPQTSDAIEIQYPNGVKLHCPTGICKDELRTLITLL